MWCTFSACFITIVKYLPFRTVRGVGWLPGTVINTMAVRSGTVRHRKSPLQLLFILAIQQVVRQGRLAPIDAGFIYFHSDKQLFPVEGPGLCCRWCKRAHTWTQSYIYICIDSDQARLLLLPAPPQTDHLPVLLFTTTVLAFSELLCACLLNKTLKRHLHLL